MKEEKIKVLALLPMELPKEIELDNTLEAMQNFVGGLIECITLSDTGSEVTLVCNDEGKLLGLPLNRPLWDGADVLAGPGFLAGCDNEGNLTSLPQSTMDFYKEKFRAFIIEIQGGQIMTFNAMTEHYEEITVCGKPALFTSIRIKRDTIPDGLYAYDVRHDDECRGIPCEIAPFVMVNHWGTIILAEPLELPDDGRRYIDEDTDWNYAPFGGTEKNQKPCVTVEEFIKTYVKQK